MGYSMGSSCFLHSPIHHSQLFFSFSSSRNVHKQKKHKAAMACMHQEDSKDANFCRRKAILFMGFAVLPLLKMKAQASDAFVGEDSGQVSQDQKQIGEQENASSNSFLSLLNGLGIFSAGVLGALYALARKEKATSDATIESMRSKLKEKEGTILSMQKKFDVELLNEKEAQNKQLKKANDEKQSLVGELASANGIITKLGQELQKEKRLAEELKFQIDSLQNNLKKVGEEKTLLQEKLKEKLDAIEVLEGRINLLSSEVKNKEDNFQRLSSILAEKETEFNNLSSIHQQSLDQVKGLESEIKELKDEIVNYKTQLQIKNASVNDLNTLVTTLLTERDETNQKFDAVQIQYSELKSHSETKAASDAKLLEEREQKLNRLQEQLEFAHDEGLQSKALIADLTHERDGIRKMLEIELTNVKNLEHELQITQATLEKSKDEASDLEKQLQQSRNLCSELEAELSKVRTEFSEARESLQREIDEVKLGAEVLADEVASANKLLKKTYEELQCMSRELTSVTESRDNLQKELADAVQELAAVTEKHDNLQKELAAAQKKSETDSHNLEEERKNVESFVKELNIMRTQHLKDEENYRSLEASYDEATEELTERNLKVLSLTRDLESANSRISSLEDEKEVFLRSLTEQKQISQEARENLEDAHNLVMRLGKERENLEKKGLKFEEELASAKGEILRLRSQINSSKAQVNNQHQEKVEVAGKEVAEKEVVPAKKTTRRRKSTPPQNDSS